MAEKTPAKKPGRILPNLLGLQAIKPNQDTPEMHAALRGQPDPVAEDASTVPAPFTLPTVSAAPVLASPTSIDSLRVGVVYELPVAMLTISRYQARIYLEEAEVDQLSVNMTSVGQEVPAKGYVKEGKVVIWDGQKRHRAAVVGGSGTLKVEITSPFEKIADEYRASRNINLQRSAQNCFDDAAAWERLLADGAFESQIELAKDLGLKEELVSKTMGLLRIPLRLRRTMLTDEKTKTLAVAYAISSYFADYENANSTKQSEMELVGEEIIQKVQRKQLSRDETARLVKTMLEGPQKRADRSESSKVRFGEREGVIRTNKAGRFTLEFTNLSEEEITKLRERTEEIFRDQRSIQ